MTVPPPVRVRVHVGKRKVAKDQSNLSVGLVEKVVDGWGRTAAVRALEVPVLDECNRRAGRPLDVVALPDGDGEVG